MNNRARLSVSFVLLNLIDLYMSCDKLRIRGKVAKEKVPSTSLLKIFVSRIYFVMWSNIVALGAGFPLCSSIGGVHLNKG